MIEINYSAPPTVSDMMLSKSFIRLIAGPVGSGKTTGLLFELMRRALMQSTALDGYRYTRFAILRQTLSQLKQTVLKDAIYWFGNFGRWKVSDATIYYHFGDVRSEWILLPLEEPEDQRRLLSMNLTGAMVSEAIEIDRELIDPIGARCGRYPPPTDGGASWNGIIMDTNMPPEGTPWHSTMTEPPPDWDIYIQPGGLTAQAENLEWLLQTPETLKLPTNHPLRIATGRTYYERLARSNNLNWVKRYVDAQFGPDPSGTAVYGSSFRYPFHVVQNLEPIPGMPLYVGQDFGRDPWSIICQMDYMGRLLVLQEVKAEDIGLITHIRQNLRPALQHARYRNMPVIVIGDPSGVRKSEYDEVNAFDILKREGMACAPAGTNDIDTRLRSVEYYLLQQRGGGPAMLFDRSRCPMLVRGMNGMYRYAKTPRGQSKPLPDKNEFSHVCDALQYATLATQGQTHRAVARTLRGRMGRPRERISAAGWT
jgi:hypothetical protein